MTRCRARRRLVQSLVPTQGVNPALAPSSNKARGLPAHYQLLSHLSIWNFSGSLGSNPHRVTTTSDNPAGSSGACSSTAEEQSGFYFPLWNCSFLSLPGWIRCPQLIADPEHHGLQKPVTETTHLQLQGSHPENINKGTWRQQHAQRIPQRDSSSLRSQRTVPNCGQSESSAILPTF